jgi:hypothetical protein
MRNDEWSFCSPGFQGFGAGYKDGRQFIGFLHQIGE